MTKLTVIDLFCGAGGLSKGFEMAGFKILAGNDNWKDALETFKINHPEVISIYGDITKKEVREKIIESVDKKVDVIIGGPPCQGFSFTGTRKFNDPRNSLYLSFYKIVKDVKPKAFVIENVIGITTLYGGAVKKDIIERFGKIGYNVKWDKLNAADYGVPQIRKRVFFVGILKEFGEFEFPIPILTPENYITCEEAIGDLPALENDDFGKEILEYDKPASSSYQKEMRKNSSKLHNHVATKHKDFVKSVISQVPEGENYKKLPSGVGESRKFHEAWTRYDSKKPSRTIDTGHRNHFHYKYNRVPTVRENARLQSFPDNFIFYGSKTQQNKQVGNAVPPLLAFFVAKQLKNQLIKN